MNHYFVCVMGVNRSISEYFFGVCVIISKFICCYYSICFWSQQAYPALYFFPSLKVVFISVHGQNGLIGDAHEVARVQPLC